MRYRVPLAAAILAGALSIPRLAATAEPAVIVEAAQGSPAGVAALDYLPAGKVIRLGPQQGLVIDYLDSCIRDSITGGTVTVGADQSRVVGGAVERRKVDCDPDKLRRSTYQAGPSGAVGFGAPPRPEGQPRETGIQKTIYGQSPLFDVGAGGKLVIEPLDPKGNPITIDLSAAVLRHRSFYDFAQAGRALAPGGVYRASAHGRSVVFWVDPLSQPGATPLVGRLIRL